MPKKTAPPIDTADLAVLESLDKAQWIEIFNALPVEGETYRAMKVDTRIEAEGMSRKDVLPMLKHTRSIYHAVWLKVTNWGYGDDSEGRRWRRDMVELLDALAPFAYCEMCGAEPGGPHQENDRGVCRMGRFKDKPVTLHTWKDPAGKKRWYCMVCRAGAKQQPLPAQTYRHGIRHDLALEGRGY